MNELHPEKKSIRCIREHVLYHPSGPDPIAMAIKKMKKKEWQTADRDPVLSMTWEKPNAIDDRKSSRPQDECKE